MMASVHDRMSLENIPFSVIPSFSFCLVDTTVSYTGSSEELMLVPGEWEEGSVGRGGSGGESRGGREGGGEMMLVLQLLSSLPP